MSMYGYNSYNNGGFNYRLWIGIIIAVVSVVGYFSHVSVNPVTGEKQHLAMTADQETQLGFGDASVSGEPDRGDQAQLKAQYPQGIPGGLVRGRKLPHD
jgi:hypothetical protein